MKKSVFVLIGLALAIASCASPTEPAATSVAEEPEGTGMPDLAGRELRIATDPIPPFIIVADDGSLTGFEPDLVAEICKLLNCTTTWENVSYDAVFAALAAGEYDAIVTDVPYSAERDENLDFTDPYFLSGQVVVVRKDLTEVQIPEDLAKPGIITAVQTGGESLGIARDLGVPDEQIKSYDTVDLKYLAIDSGDADATIDTVEIAGEFVNLYEGKLRILSDENGIIYISRETIHIVVQEGDDELREAFNAAIQQLKQDGTIAALLEKWNLPISIPE